MYRVTTLLCIHSLVQTSFLLVLYSVLWYSIVWFSVLFLFLFRLHIPLDSIMSYSGLVCSFMSISILFYFYSVLFLLFLILFRSLLFCSIFLCCIIQSSYTLSY